MPTRGSACIRGVPTRTLPKISRTSASSSTLALRAPAAWSMRANSCRPCASSASRSRASTWSASPLAVSSTTRAFYPIAAPGRRGGTKPSRSRRERRIPLAKPDCRRRRGSSVAAGLQQPLEPGGGPCGTVLPDLVLGHARDVERVLADHVPDLVGALAPGQDEPADERLLTRG